MFAAVQGNICSRSTKIIASSHLCVCKTHTFATCEKHHAAYLRKTYLVLELQLSPTGLDDDESDSPDQPWHFPRPTISHELAPIQIYTLGQPWTHSPWLNLDRRRRTSNIREEELAEEEVLVRRGANWKRWHTFETTTRRTSHTQMTDRLGITDSCAAHVRTSRAVVPKGSAARGGATSADDEQRQVRGGGHTAYGGCGEVKGAVGGALAPFASRRTAATTGSCRAMSKRAKMSEPDARTTIMGSSVFQFRVDYIQSKQLPIGEAVHSDVVSAGGHLWRIEFYPRGDTAEYNGEYTSVFLRHMSKSRSANAIFEAFMMPSDSKPSISFKDRRTFETFKIMGVGKSWGWKQFLKISTLKKNFLTEGHVTFVCVIMVIDDSPIPVPPSDIGTHLGQLLDHTDGTDVSFIVNDKTFPAHRAVLAARSPVFRAELFGSMAEATMPSITLHDITPATFKVMLRFIYTDELPVEDEHLDSSIEMIQNLLAAADRYAIDRLKFICAQKLWDKVTIGTVATILACAETYNCHELKNRCIDFFVLEENFKEAIFTDG
ncbi:hypothetical protein QYE76_009638 [Lolium multiflorum]|uniref:Uncharacterized protein n=1 Tax=Lolium multiflorum TaxID=4521 RepID=A0AAD8X1E9_LOLMU|nr:hypothetical protein QYE76_009638 [Lolium multiflorum]